MRLGPFHEREIDEVTRILTDIQVQFEVRLDVDELNRLDQEYKAQMTTPHTRGPAFEPNALFIEIANLDIQRVGDKLEKFGIAYSSGERELEGDDYVCKVCGSSQPSPGFCPKDRTPLLIFSEYKKWQEAKAFRIPKRLQLVILVLVGALMLYFYTKRWN